MFLDNFDEILKINASDENYVFETRNFGGGEKFIRTCLCSKILVLFLKRIPYATRFLSSLIPYCLINPTINFIPYIVTYFDKIYVY